MRTTVVLKDDLLEEAKKVSGIRTNKNAIETALKEFVSRKKAERLIKLEGKIELSFTMGELLKRRRKDVPR